MSNKKKHFFGANIGSSFLLMIFVTICLISFAALSLVSANADKRLTDKIAERTTSYYQASNEAEEKMVEIDHLLQEAYESSADETSYFAQVGEGVSFSVPISETQNLLVELDFLYPSSGNDGFYRIAAWKIVTPDKEGTTTTITD